MDIRTKIPTMGLRVFHKEAFNISIIILVSVLIFWHSLKLPLIQDDWGLAEAAMFNNLFQLLKRAFDPHEALFYRPLGISYLLIMMKIFKDNAFPFHFVGLIIHICNSVLVCKILTKITRDFLIGFCSSIIYASAIAIHLDTLCWAVGIYDLAGAFFFFCSLYFFSNSKFKLSVATVFLGLLVKESTVITPLILFVFSFFENNLTTPKRIRTALSEVTPHICSVALVLCLKFFSGNSIFNLYGSHPYFISFYGEHILINVLQYFIWMFQAMIPLQLNFQLGVVLVLLLTVSCLTFTRLQNIATKNISLNLLLWCYLALVPVLFLPNHSYRYYATYSLPALIAIWMFLIKAFSSALKFNFAIKTISFGWCLLCVCLAFQKSNFIFQQGLNTGVWQDGTNTLIRRAAITNIVRNGLLEQTPQLAPGTIILLDNVDLSAFDGSSGPRVWYRNNQITVHSLRDIAVRSKNNPILIFRRNDLELTALTPIEAFNYNHTTKN